MPNPRIIRLNFRDIDIFDYVTKLGFKIMKDEETPIASPLDCDFFISFAKLLPEGGNFVDGHTMRKLAEEMGNPGGLCACGIAWERHHALSRDDKKLLDNLQVSFTATILQAEGRQYIAGLGFRGEDCHLNFSSLDGQFGYHVALLESK